MTKTIYNEGRVVGESAYEEYVRQLKSVDPDFDACTEREWLSASLGMGTSLILKIPKGAGSKVSSSSDLYIYQVELPYGSHLGAGNPILGTYFYGECECDEKGWATVVTDYGSLISNTSSSSPKNDSTIITTSTVPTKDISSELELPDTTNVSDISYTTEQLRLHEYIKIVDGIVIQPGTWEETDSGNPYKDFKPNLSLNPVIRLTFYEKITNPFYILLTGFTNRSILRGSSKFDLGAVDTEHPEDGDFIGCECYPWSAKIQFASSPAIDYLNTKNLIRGSRNLKVETYNDQPLIKITSNNLLDTTVYSRQSNTTTGTNGTDNFGSSITTWEGTNDASHWYGSTRDSNVTSTCDDSLFDTSGNETVTTYNLKNKYDNSTSLGFTVENHYESDDREQIKNGDHGGWYDIEIDPYQMIKDFIDEVIARFKYIDTRLDEIESEIANEIKHRTNGDKYILEQLYSNSDGSLSQLINLINQLLDIVYDEDGLNIKVTWKNENLDDSYDEEITGTIKIPVISWENGAPSSDEGKIPRAKLNIYSGETSGSSATSFLRSRTDNSEDDLYAK